MDATDCSRSLCTRLFILLYLLLDLPVLLAGLLPLLVALLGLAAAPHRLAHGGHQPRQYYTNTDTLRILTTGKDDIKLIAKDGKSHQSHPRSVILSVGSLLQQLGGKLSTLR